jgi:L-2-hydroxyglutarate oxidase
MSRVNVTIVGGGIVGLSTALHTARRNPGSKVVVVEKEARLAAHQTGHNSGVIHSGLYYKPGSLKARLCIEGYSALLDFCRRREIAHEVCGKVVVATNEQERSQLDELARRASANGLDGVRRLTASDIRVVEPHCAGIDGLFVPQTGIVDYTDVAEAMAVEAQELGVVIRLDTTLRDISLRPGAALVSTTSGEWESDHVITCAGLHSDRVARTTEENLDVRIVPFRGEYFELTPQAEGLVKNLIYPVPDPAFPFLGVHFTRMITGGVECGPNAVLALAREGYTKTTMNARDLAETIAWPGFRRVAGKYWRTGIGEMYRSVSKAAFVRALQRLVPDVRSSHLVSAPAGVRAQACHRDGSLLDDFALRGSGRVVHVCNAPSPAATASLAIGKYVVDSVLS